MREIDEQRDALDQEARPRARPVGSPRAVRERPARRRARARDVELDFVVLTLSDDREAAIISGRAAPPFVRVVDASDEARLEDVLGAGPVVCGAVVDAALPPDRLERLVALVELPWRQVPKAVLVPSCTSSHIDAAEELGEVHVFRASREAVKVRQLRGFIEASSRGTLEWAARLLGCAERAGIRGAALHTFAGLVIRKLDRPALARQLGIKPRTIEDHVRSIADELDPQGLGRSRRLERILQGIHIPPGARTPREIVERLEAAAIERRRHRVFPGL